MSGDVKRTLGIVGGLLLLAGTLLLIVPATNVWPFVLLFWAVGGGFLLSMAIGRADEVRRHHASEGQR